MTFNSLKNSINISLTKVKDVSNQDKIIIGCLVYEAINSIISFDRKKNGQINDLADKYVVSFKGIVESLQDHYISYREMELLIKKNNITSFGIISFDLLQKILDLYRNKSKIQTFNTNYYSQYMYSILYIDTEENKRMEKVHMSVMSPLVKYLKTFKNIKESDVKIEPIDYVNRNYSKSFNITIKGINAGELYGEIASDACNIMKYIYSVSINENNSVNIIIK